jgi:hypothetical protein
MFVESLSTSGNSSTTRRPRRRKYGNQCSKTPLGEVIRLGLPREGTKMRLAARNKRKGYFLRAETLFGLAEVVSGMLGC